jgi:hypothetical protein
MTAAAVANSATTNVATVVGVNPNLTQTISVLTAGDALILYIVNASAVSGFAASAVSSTTVGTTGWTRGVSIAGTVGTIEIWYNLNPAIPSGTNTITITLIGTAPLAGCRVEEWSLPPSSIGWAVESIATNSGTSTSPSLSQTLNRVGDFAVVFSDGIAQTASPAGNYLSSSGPTTSGVQKNGCTLIEPLFSPIYGPTTATWTTATSSAWTTCGIVFTGGYTQSNTEFGVATSGNTVTISSIAPAPIKGSLLYLACRLPAVTAISSPPSGWTQIQSPISTAGSAPYYDVAYYKVATGTESSASLTWTGTAASTGVARAVMEYAEFSGFLGTPTLDLFAQGGGTIATAGSAATSGSQKPSKIPELSVGFLVTASTMTVNATATYSATSSGSQSMVVGPFLAPNNAVLGWVQYTAVPSNGAAQTWTFTWTSGGSSRWAVQGATFYDRLPWVTGRVRFQQGG